MWIAVAVVVWRSKSLKTFFVTAGICSLTLIALLAISGRSMSGPALVAVFAAVFGWGGIGTLARRHLTYDDAVGGVVATRNKLRPAQDAALKKSEAKGSQTRGPRADTNTPTGSAGKASYAIAATCGSIIVGIATLVWLAIDMRNDLAVLRVMYLADMADRARVACEAEAKKENVLLNRSALNRPGAIRPTVERHTLDLGTMEGNTLSLIERGFEFARDPLPFIPSANLVLDYGTTTCAYSPAHGSARIDGVSVPR
jgi:hypothetical protein